MEKLESKDEENIKFKELEEMVFNFFNDLRFNDGTKVEEKVLEVSSDEGTENPNEDESEEEINENDMKEIMLDEDEKARIGER